MSPKDHIDAILDGLPPEYDTLVLSVNTRTDPYTVPEIEALLLAQEVRIEKNFKSLDCAMANVAFCSPFHAPRRRFSGHNHGHSRGSCGFSFPTSQGYFPTGYHGYSSSGFPFRGFPASRGGRHGVRPPTSNNNKLQCQLCGKMGHMVERCYYRFDPSFKRPAQLQRPNHQQFTSATQGNVDQF